MSTFAACAVFAAAFLGLSTPVRAQDEQVVRIYLGESARVAVDGVSKVVISDPEVVEVIPVTTSVLVFNGKKMGTCVVTLFEKDRERALRVVVEQNTLAIAMRIKMSIGNPGVKVTIAEQNIILEGVVENQDDRNRAVTIASAFLPALRVGKDGGGQLSNVYNGNTYPKGDDNSEGDVADAKAFQAPTPDGIVDFLRIRNQRQVRLSIQVMRIRNDDLRDFGLKFSDQISAGIGIIGGGAVFHNRTDHLPSVFGFGTTGDDTFEIEGVSKFSDPVDKNKYPFKGNPKAGLTVALRILENKGLARTLANPIITTLDGAEASFLAGGKVILSMGGFSGGIYTTTVQTEEVGVKVFFRPKIMGNGRINLFVTPKVSEPPQDIGQGSFFIASRNTRNNVEMNAGDTMVLSGLFEMTDAASVNKFPWLADIPIIGELFKNRANEKSKQELVFFVTPEIINTPASAAVGPDMPVRSQELRDWMQETGTLTPPASISDPSKELAPVSIPLRSGANTAPVRPGNEPAAPGNRTPETKPSASAEAAQRMADLLHEARPSGVPTEMAASDRAAAPNPKLR